MQAARDANATAVLATQITFADRQFSPGCSVGLGGFGGGRRGGVGVGGACPSAAGNPSPAAAGVALTDIAKGRVVWTAKATTPPSADLNGQMGELAKAIVGAAEQAGLF